VSTQGRTRLLSGISAGVSRAQAGKNRRDEHYRSDARGAFETGPEFCRDRSPVQAGPLGDRCAAERLKMEVVSRRGDHGCVGRWNDREALRETHGRSDKFQAIGLAGLLQQVTMPETAIAPPDPL